ncbi:hypothetical protein L1987_18234 [Smallanthus sonchifolius]|uniref:Uncharacterized protein n=1 Tax=Smallanthus sonchifolius TaxID=185202 RepID=A0ACB9IZP9_9ASTR|nr:hypothetical protein L1987_18234 [Smallanthus sonchifolius]
MRRRLWRISNPSLSSVDLSLSLSLCVCVGGHRRWRFLVGDSRRGFMKGEWWVTVAEQDLNGAFAPSASPYCTICFSSCTITFCFSLLYHWPLLIVHDCRPVITCQEGNSLWKRVISGCNGSARTWSSMPCSSTASGCWKSIVKIGDKNMSNGCSLNTYFAGSVGNGSTILFWGDTWIRDVPLRLLYPNLFRLEEDKWVVVNNRMKVINGIKTLVWGWRSEPTSHDEIAELFHLLEDLFNFEWTGGCDTWRWKGDAREEAAFDGEEEFEETVVDNTEEIDSEGEVEEDENKDGEDEEEEEEEDDDVQEVVPQIY